MPPELFGRPASASVAVGHSQRTVTVGGTERTVLLYRPDGTAQRAPLVVMLHGGYGSASQAESTYGWDEQADTAKFLVAYPDGLYRSWNAGTCCGPPAALGVDDVAFVSEVVRSLEAEGAVDADRVYVTGMSNGAMLAYRLACSTDLFAAVAPVAGTILVDCGNATPTSVLHIHGAADKNVPYGGGPGSAVTVAGEPRVDGPSVPADNATWRAIDQCEAPVVATTGAVSTSTATCPRRSHRRADHDRRCRTPVAGSQAEPSGATAARHRSAVDGDRCHAGHLGLLRGALQVVAPRRW